MQATCKKCGAKSEVELTSTTPCPQCGAIYSRVEAAERGELQQQLRERALAARQEPDAPTAIKPPRSVLVTIAWAIAALLAVVGAGEFVFGMARAESAPQQAVAATAALAYAVIPYCFARAVEKLVRG
jgi:uncharacterized membrane protein YvbJ